MAATPKVFDMTNADRVYGTVDEIAPYVVRAQRKAQGLPPRVENPAVYDRLVSLAGGGRRG